MDGWKEREEMLTIYVSILEKKYLQVNDAFKVTFHVFHEFISTY